MTSKSERELQNEITYLTKLIEAHKRGPQLQRRPNPGPVPKHGKTNKFKWRASCQGDKSASPVPECIFTRVPHQAKLSSITSTGTPQGQPTPKPSHPHHSHLHNCHPHSSTHHYHSHPHPHHSTQQNYKSLTKRGNLVFVPGKVSFPNVPSVPTEPTKRGNLVYVPSKVPSPNTRTVPTDLTKQGNLVYVPGKAPSPNAPPTPTNPIKKRGNLVFVPAKAPPPVTTDPRSNRVKTSSKTRPSCAAGALATSSIAQSTAPGREGGSSGPKSIPVSKRPSPLPSKAQLKWKRPTSPKTPKAITSTPKSPHIHGNRKRLSSTGRYKWKRRRSHSGSRKSLALKSPLLKTKPHPLPWIVHNRYKLTCASILHKYKLLHRQRHSSVNHSFRLGRSPISCASTQHILKKTRSKNRVWLAGSGESSGRPSLTPKRRSSNRGRERKTRQGNRLWVAGRQRKTLSVTSLGPKGQSQGEGTTLGGGSRRGRGSGGGGGRGGGVGRGRGGLFNQLVSFSGQKFVVDSGRRRMKRLSSSVFSSTSSPLHRARLRVKSVSESSAVKYYLASRAVQRSRQYVWSAKQRRIRMAREAKQYCIFYNRFGKCNRGKTCPYTHDPDKVAVCTKFLRGICDKTDGSCPFSHTVSREKMPACSFFLRGVCTREDCPYLHVSVGKNAKVCYDFARGYCPNGDQCTKMHILVCPEFSKTGSCPRGSKCPLKHKRVTKKLSPETKAQPVLPTREPVAFRRLRPRPDPESESSSPLTSHSGMECEPSPHAQRDFIPLDQDSRAPDFIAL